MTLAEQIRRDTTTQIEQGGESIVYTQLPSARWFQTKAILTDGFKSIQLKSDRSVTIESKNITALISQQEFEKHTQSDISPTNFSPKPKHGDLIKINRTNGTTQYADCYTVKSVQPDGNGAIKLDLLFSGQVIFNPPQP